jgi:hypothetical protein
VLRAQTVLVVCQLARRLDIIAFQDPECPDDPVRQNTLRNFLHRVLSVINR